MLFKLLICKFFLNKNVIVIFYLIIFYLFIYKFYLKITRTHKHKYTHTHTHKHTHKYKHTIHYVHLMIEDSQITRDNFIIKNRTRGNINPFTVICYDNDGSF